MKNEIIGKLAALSLRLSRVGLPLAYGGVVVEASGDAFEDALRFYRAAGWMAAHDLCAFFGG